MSARILVVDDDDEIRAMLDSTLRFSGFEVTQASTGADAIAALAAAPPDVVVLDVMMPGVDGFEVVQLIRRRDATLPVLFLSARDAVEDRVRGLRLGGDDYVTKPFSAVEVVARIETLLRRAAPTEAPSDDAAIRVADVVLDEQRHLVERGGTRIDLSPTEFRLLRMLMDNADHVLSKSQILREVWLYDFGGEANVVERFISSLRRKLDAHGDPLIETVRGFGYVLRTDAGR
ncbi:response regulator transcription factor [Microbacterium schleiferi]|uniref:Response regulator transcription factor n=1 Tax=Microbacterium schleiferi TaxID=69362 RepID=A0A7S8MX61_9MICO|nr:response regulator transcription factor [Microbacterium schleiferi]QPE04035.1 response regulator transcription factor [Microbacterium schleiferi]